MLDMDMDMDMDMVCYCRTLCTLSGMIVYMHLLRDYSVFMTIQYNLQGNKIICFTQESAMTSKKVYAGTYVHVCMYELCIPRCVPLSHFSTCIHWLQRPVPRIVLCRTSPLNDDNDDSCHSGIGEKSHRFRLGQGCAIDAVRSAERRTLRACGKWFVCPLSPVHLAPRYSHTPHFAIVGECRTNRGSRRRW